MACSTACGVDSGQSIAMQAEGSACSVGSPEAQWTSQPFAAQTGRVHVEMIATPSESPIDAVVGFSNGPASWFPDLAAIVRFNPSGMIDARAGSEYRADVEFPYTRNASYRIRVDIDIGRHVYSVGIDGPGRSDWVARDYPFRTEQAQVGQLNNLVTQVDSDSGSIAICRLNVVKINTECPLAEADGGFIAIPFGQPGEVLVSSEFVATPDEDTIDGVLGLSFRPAGSFNDLAATVRFSPTGEIEARNGDHFQADPGVPYFGGEPQRMRILANVRTHTFSAFVARGDHNSIRIAQSYAFRTTQAAAPGLDTLNAIVDSPRGILSVCNERHAISVGVRSLHEGNYAVAPIPGALQEALIATDTTTRRVTDDGRTLATLAAGGQVAADPVGNVYLARISGTDLVLEAYTAGFVPRWTRSLPVGTGKRVAAIGADAASVVVATGFATSGVDVVKRWLADGSESITYPPTASGDVIAIGSNGFATGLGRHNQFGIRKWSFDRDVPDWHASFSNSAHIDAIALSPSGKVYFGGTFTTPVSFGGPTVQPQPGDPGNVYVAALSATGDHLFTQNIHQSALRGIASSGLVTAISALAGPGLPRLIALDPSGGVLHGEEERFPFNSLGDAGSVVMNGLGRVYWNFSEAWPSVDAPAYPYLVSLDPGI
jgi:hypothetical protein